MFKKYLILASKKDKAGMNIANQLSQFKDNPVLSSWAGKPSFDIYLVEEEAIYTENLNMQKINEYDFIIFASRHKSEKQEKSLSVHSPGNFRKADYGGMPGKVCPSSALFNKFIFQKLNEQATKFELKDFKITLEVTHHGPLINRRLGFIIAKTIQETVEEFQENKYKEIAVGIGGPHYCPSFNNIQLKSNVAIAHVIAEYNSPINAEMIQESIKKTLEDVDFVLLDWKGLGKSEQRQEVVKILEDNYIQWKKTSDITR